MQSNVEEKRPTIRQKLQSRNFWNFAIASTLATCVFFYLLGKCTNADFTYNHEAAYKYFDMWGTTIMFFSAIFSSNGILKEAVNKFPTKGGANG